MSSPQSTFEPAQPISESLRSQLIGRVETYCRRFPEDAVRVEPFLSFFLQNQAWLYRSNQFGHVTASAWVLSPDQNSVVLVRHKRLNRWLQPGGHADGDAKTLRAAAREVIEETGLFGLEVFDLKRGSFAYIDEGNLDAEPFDLDHHPIPATEHFPAHIHFDFRYLLRAGTTETVCLDAGVEDVRWFTAAELTSAVSEPGILRMAQRARLLLTGPRCFQPS